MRPRDDVPSPEPVQVRVAEHPEEAHHGLEAADGRRVEAVLAVS